MHCFLVYNLHSLEQIGDHVYLKMYADIFRAIILVVCTQIVPLAHFDGFHIAPNIKNQ